MAVVFMSDGGVAKVDMVTELGHFQCQWTQLANDSVTTVSVLQLTSASRLWARHCSEGLWVPYIISQFLMSPELSFIFVYLFLPLSSFVA